MNTIVTGAPIDKSVDDYITEMKALTSPELEAILRSYQGKKPEDLPDSELRKGLAALRLHRRTTAGPPKAKGKPQVLIDSLL